MQFKYKLDTESDKFHTLEDYLAFGLDFNEIDWKIGNQYLLLIKRFDKENPVYDLATFAGLTRPCSYRFAQHYKPNERRATKHLSPNLDIVLDVFKNYLNSDGINIQNRVQGHVWRAMPIF